MDCFSTANGAGMGNAADPQGTIASNIAVGFVTSGFAGGRNVTFAETEEKYSQLRPGAIYQTEVSGRLRLLLAAEQHLFEVRLGKLYQR
jgi:hypothetical protein